MSARKLALLFGALFAVIVLACSAGGTPDSSDKAKRDCKARGGTYQSTGKHSGRCLPPEGGWQ